jgi:hypothetical protein
MQHTKIMMTSAVSVDASASAGIDAADDSVSKLEVVFPFASEVVPPVSTARLSTVRS